MAEENKNGSNGDKVSLLVKVKAGIKEDVQCWNEMLMRWQGSQEYYLT